MLSSLIRSKLLVHNFCNSRHLASFKAPRVIPLSKPSVGEQDNDPDTFGTLAKDSTNLNIFSTLGADPEDLDDHDGEEAYQAKIADTNRPRPFDYLIRMEKLLKKGSKDYKKSGAMQLQEALTLLDVEMKVECVRPIPEHYRVLIHACGRVGHFEKAFLLFREYNLRKYPVNFGIFADLFNGCANAPKMHQDRALEQTNILRRKISEITPSLPRPVYHTMIKAYGRCGDLQTAFDIIDEMKEKRHLVDAETIGHLLQGCISDKDAGFRHALVVWRRLRTKKLEPDVMLFNLMLRAVKECNAGPKDAFYDLIIETLPSGKEVKQFKEKLLAAKTETKEKSQHDPVSEGAMVLVDKSEKQLMMKSHIIPNFLAPKPNLKDIYGIGDLSSPIFRFQLLGGIRGFIATASEVDKVKLNIKTFSQMLNCIEDTPEAEEALLQEIKALGIQTDVDFFNQLIRRQARRGDAENGRKTIELLSSEFGHSPDVMTFGCLALCCDSLKSSRELLKSMEERGYSPNIEIMTALIKGTIRRKRPFEVAQMILQLKRYRLKPNTKTIETLERFYRDFQGKLVAAEKTGEMNDKSVAFEIENGLGHWKLFTQVYSEWLKRTEIEFPEHPWKQYLTAKDIKMRNDGNLAFKAVI